MICACCGEPMGFGFYEMIEVKMTFCRECTFNPTLWMGFPNQVAEAKAYTKQAIQMPLWKWSP